MQGLKDWDLPGKDLQGIIACGRVILDLLLEHKKTKGQKPFVFFRKLTGSLDHGAGFGSEVVDSGTITGLALAASDSVAILPKNA